MHPSNSAEHRAPRLAQSASRSPSRDLTIDLRFGEPIIELPDPKPSWTDLDQEELVELVAAAKRSNPHVYRTRAFDLIVAGTLLVATIPLVAALAALVRLSSSGPVFFASDRWARRTGTFGAWKLRTMVGASEQRQVLAANPELAELLERDCKLVNDPRVTRVGRLLRRTSLDELPQLWNVVRGDMSLVGPRPKTLEESGRYGPALEPILSIRPGLTGLWQTSGRNDLPFESRILLDLDYVANRTLRGDLRLCMITIRQLLTFRRHGAY